MTRKPLHWLAALALLALAGMAAVRASSQAPACSAESIDNFNVIDASGRVTWRVPDMECVEFFNLGLETPYGPRRIRAIGDINAETFMPPGGMRELQAAAAEITRRIGGLGDYRVANISILVSPVGPRAPSLVDVDGEGVWKHTRTAAATSPRSIEDDGECTIRLFIVNPLDDDDLKIVLAHEIFHCVQMSSLRVEQLEAHTPWWLEGSAELFAQYAFPDLPEAIDRTSAFRDALAAQEPVFRMSYEALYFWLYYFDRTGIAGLMPALRDMPTSNADSVQIAELQRLMATEDWLRFAEDVDDNKVRYINGQIVDFGPPVDIVSWHYATSGSQNFTAKPFVIMPGWTDYECGLWENTLNPGDANIALHEDDEDGWRRWPATTDCREERSIRYRTVAINTANANSRFALRADRTEGCAGCTLPRAEIDRCLVGSWEQTSGGPLEWLQRLGIPPVTRNNIGRLRMTFRDDGTMVTAPMRIDYQLTIPRGDDGPVVNDNSGDIAATTGRWSASRGQIHGCIDGGGEAHGTMHGTYPDGLSWSGPFSYGSTAGASGSSTYTCNASMLRTSMPMPRGGPMTYEFRRMSVP